MNFDLSVNTYRMRKYKIDEYRSDMIRLLNENETKTDAAFMVFKRIYKDAGYWINGTVKDNDLKIAVALGADLDSEYTILSQMRNEGLLDKYLL